MGCRGRYRSHRRGTCQVAEEDEAGAVGNEAGPVPNSASASRLGGKAELRPRNKTAGLKIVPERV